MDLVQERAELAIELALQEHRRVVRDVDGSPTILGYYQDGLGWTWQTTYRNGRDKWCGAFTVGTAWGRGGLRPEIRKKSGSSTGRLILWAHETPRWHRPQDARPGDILLLGDTEATHIGLALTGCVAGLISTVEGNSFGLLGDGTLAEGVVTHDRHVRASGYRVHAAIRPLPEDLEPDFTPPAAPRASSQE